MSDFNAEILKSVRDAHQAIVEAESGNKKTLSELRTSVDELYRRTGRPGLEGRGSDTSERKDATDYCVLKHELATPKNDGITPTYVPSSSEVEDATLAIKALHSIFRTGNDDRVEYKKQLSSFSFGSNEFVLPPQMSNRVLTCLVDPTDVAGLMGQATTSGGSLKFMIDNPRMLDAAFACEASCFSNNPQPDLQEGIGTLEIRVDPIRYIVCADSTLLQDAAFDIEQWILRKASLGFRNTINNAIIAGSGVGMPLGLLNPSAGIPICETSGLTPPGQFTWQDLVMLKYEVPVQWHQGASYFMNQRTLALLLTMSDASNRPLWGQLPGGLPGYIFAGSPIQIVSQMPDVGPGSIPVAFGNWAETYCVVTRSGMTMRPDPYSAGFCVLFRFEARIGGAPLCPNAARLMRIR